MVEMHVTYIDICHVIVTGQSQLRPLGQIRPQAYMHGFVYIVHFGNNSDHQYSY